MKNYMITEPTAQALLDYFAATEEGALMAALLKGLKVVPETKDEQVVHDGTTDNDGS